MNNCRAGAFNSGGRLELREGQVYRQSQLPFDTHNYLRFMAL